MSPFFLRERGPLVQDGAIKQKLPAKRHLDDVGIDRARQDRFDVHRLAFSVLGWIGHEFSQAASTRTAMLFVVDICFFSFAFVRQISLQ